jgi:DNA-binding NarL/FixJ family response regulator
MAPARIVIADDNADIRARVRNLLEEDFQPVRQMLIEVATASEAIIVCLSQPVDVLVLSLELPDVSGLEVLRALAAAAPLPCVIAWSADPLALRRAPEFGAHQAVDKAAGVERLIEAIEYCLAPLEGARS